MSPGQQPGEYLRAAGAFMKAKHCMLSGMESSSTTTPQRHHLQLAASGTGAQHSQNWHAQDTQEALLHRSHQCLGCKLTFSCTGSCR